MFHIRFMPSGAFTSGVTSAGRWPCDTALAAYRMNQANRSMSWDTPLAGTTCAWLAGSAHRCQVMANAPARYSSGTSQSAGWPGSRHARRRSASGGASTGRRTKLTAAPR